MKNRIRNFDIQTKLGSGSYGVIFKALNKTTRQVCVLKQISLGRLNEKARKSAINEATIMGKLVHPFIVRYQQSFIQQNTLNIVMEYCDNGDLNNYLKLQNKRQLKQQKIWKFFIQICIGLEFIHKNKILHRDIKALNIFMNKNEQIKIGDLGVAKMLTSNQFAQTMVGTPFYLSPELCQQKPYNQKSDIWALGCLLYQLCTFRHPFEAQNQASLILKIIRGKFTAIPQSYSKQLKDVIDLCLQRDYKRRPSASNILARPKIQEMIQQFNINKIIDDYSKKVIKQKQNVVAPIRQMTQERIATGNKDKIIKPVEIVDKKIIKAVDNQPKKELKREQIKKPQIKLQQPPKRQQIIKKQQIKRQPIIILPKQSQKKIQSVNVRRSTEQNIDKKESKNDFVNNLQKMIQENQKAKRVSKSNSNYNEQPIKSSDIRKQDRKQKISEKVQQFRKEGKQLQIVKSPSQLQSKRDTPGIPQKKNITPSEINSVRRPEINKTPMIPMIPKPPASQNSQITPKEGCIKVKNDKIIQPKVYESQKNVAKPQGIIKSRGFSSHIDEQKVEPLKLQTHSKQRPQDKIMSAKRYSNPAMKLQKEKDEPKQLFGPSPIQQHKSNKLIKQVSSVEQKKQQKKQEVNKISRVRKGGKNQLSRYAKNASRINEISKQEEDMIMNLPTNVKNMGLPSSDSEQDQPYKDKQVNQDPKSKTNKSKFQLKDIDDYLVLQKYEEMMNSEQVAKGNENDTENNVEQQSQSEQQINQQFERQIQQQSNKDRIKEVKALDREENVVQEDLQYIRKNSNQPIEEVLQAENGDENLQKQLGFQKQFDEQNYEMVNEREEWSYDQEPELPMLQQKQNGDFEQNNPYLIEQQETTSNKINHLQIKLQQNMKRQDQINKLMNLKIEECRRFVNNQKSLQEIFQFFRKKLNMEQEISESDEKEIQLFLKKKGLTDQNKFQNIYKIMHFEMELANTRIIIQRICKKLSEFEGQS